MPIQHLCPKKTTCFSCRRFFQSENTYIHDNLKKQFCDKNVTSEASFNCLKCNLTLYSQHCFLGHKRFCYGKNISFGMKCKNCHVFTYKGSSSTNIFNHQCGGTKMCKFCFQPKEPNHLCRLKTEIVNKNWPRIGFIGSASIDNLPENCFSCTKSETCEFHKDIQKDFEFNLFLIFMYREEKKRGSFAKYVLSPDLNINTRQEDAINYQYFKNIENHPFQKYNQAQKKTTDFERNYEQLIGMSDTTLIRQILLLTMDKDFANTTYICQNNNSTTFVSLKETRPVWTGFKIAVRPKLLTHYNKVRCLDTIIICNS